MVNDPGRRASQMILNIDLAPTLLDIVGVGIPTNRHRYPQNAERKRECLETTTNC